MNKEDVRRKRKARKFALQALYQWLMTGAAIAEIEVQFLSINNMERVDLHHFKELLHGIPQQLNKIQQTLDPHLDRPLQQLNPIELTLLRLGAYELIFCTDTPFKVILDESILLAKEFGSQDGYRYVNGVLNNLARQVRTDEIK